MSEKNKEIENTLHELIVGILSKNNLSNEDKITLTRSCVYCYYAIKLTKGNNLKVASPSKNDSSDPVYQPKEYESCSNYCFLDNYRNDFSTTVEELIRMYETGFEEEMWNYIDSQRDSFLHTLFSC